MTAGELLALDFFNEWSVHLDCSWTNRHNILQFRIRDDVIRNNRKEGEAIQFDYNLNTDEPERMAVELVSNYQGTKNQSLRNYSYSRDNLTTVI